MNGEASYFDGATARKRSVQLAFDPDGLVIQEDGERIAFWRFDALRQADAPQSVLRVSAVGAPELARLEIRDPALAETIVARCPGLKDRRHHGSASTRHIIFWSLAATVSLVLTVIYLVPLFADRLAPLVPIPLEQRLGEAVDNQMRTLFGNDACSGADGTAALDKLAARLTVAADLPMSTTVAVLPSDTVNAVALPGGRIYIFNGLLQLAEDPDEIAGVIAHEMGHVANRDGLRKLIQTSGSAFLLGLLFGDITGGGAIVFGTQMLVDSSYSRHAEAEADGFAADLMLKVGRSPVPLGTLLSRLQSGLGNALAFISSHPVTEERMHALEAAARPVMGAPLIDAEEWRELKTICGSED